MKKKLMKVFIIIYYHKQNFDKKNYLTFEKGN